MEFPSSPTHKRKPIGNLFNHDSSASKKPPSSPVKRTKMLSDLQRSVRQNWPTMRQPSTQVPMTIRADSSYRTYAADQDPKVLFEKATRYLGSMRGVERTPEQQEILIKEIHESIIHAIFGSNRIEGAGLGFDVTLHLCRKILRGEPVPEIDERDPDYESKLLELYNHDKTLKGRPRQYVLRGRREIVQHMRAFQHIIHHFVVLEEDMTEDLIKETHAILCKGVSIIDPEYPEVHYEEYAGKYRNVAVGAGNTMFVTPKFVPDKMREMCANMKKDIEEGEAQNSLDPFSLSSKYSLRFVEIHPFRDGNGRMCRMILNAILFRYAGIVVPIGEREEDRVEYMDIKKRASRDMEGHGEYATFVLKKGARAIQKLKKKLHGKRSA
ncbi:fido domain-containing protein [Fusarium redolens]|uniref:Fido domain-containing protein n=1 Tax=Fusarium redolens TaxID=48865 RepID=A0A9P9KSE7_FUSRE|nr:fido domain-containing protein [Fusarium redolens]KAH7267671.1 fido domain-containing protein [Fusarium redolens]